MANRKGSARALSWRIAKAEQIFGLIGPNEHSSFEEHLWHAVLIQELIELSRFKKAENRIRAEAWLHSRDFRMVCDMAGYEASYVLRKYEEAVNRGFTADNSTNLKE